MCAKWVKRRLESFAKIYSGKDYKENPQGDAYPIYGTGGVIGYTGVKLNSGPAVLTGRKGTIDRPEFVEGDFWHVDTVFCIKPDETVECKLLYYSFASRNLNYLNEATGVPSVTSSALYGLQFTFPTATDEQRRIAEILSTCDEVITRSRAAVEKLRRIKAGMLNDFFTRGIGTDGQLRPTPQQDPKLYKDSPLGPIPKEWEIESIGESFNLLGNNTFSRAMLDDQPGPIFNVHYGDVLVKYDTIIDCSRGGLPSLRDGVNVGKAVDYAQEGDLIFADTAEDDTVGKAVELVNVEDLKIVSGLHTIFMRPKERRFASRWLGYFVNSNVFHSQLLPFVAGSKVSSISRGNIKRAFVLIPKEAEQRRVVDRLLCICDEIDSEVKLIAKYRSVKAGLMQRLLSPPADAEVEENISA